jgi:hypothetical protein
VNYLHSVLVDDGCGLGRVLQGLASAPRFKTASYVAIDEPIPQSVRQLASEVGASANFLERERYLKAPVEADVLAVNVLHHIPFSELPSHEKKEPMGGDASAITVHRYCF